MDIPKIVLSSFCFKETNLIKLFDFILKNNLEGIELSANINYLDYSRLYDLINNHINKIGIYIHNYFPRPVRDFVLNLGHPYTIKDSIEHIRYAVDLCSELGIAHYSFHAGMALNPSSEDLGKLQSYLTPIDFRESRKLLFVNCLELADYAQKKQVELSIENNVVSCLNCPDGINDRYHLADARDFPYFNELFKHPNLSMLLDIGHLKVSANTLNFNSFSFIRSFIENIKVIHLSENDGKTDQNLPIKSDSWFWNFIPWKQVEYVSLEVSKQPFDILLDQLALIKQKIVDHFG